MMRQLLLWMHRLGSRVFSREEHGQDLLEYGLLMALIAIVAVAGVTKVGETVYNVFWKAIANNF
jgi:Flp pilus assembly pilin Flp